MNARLQLLSGRDAGGEFPVPGQGAEQPSLLVGRDPVCDMRINDSQLSRRHCRFFAHEGHVYVEDLQSSNGTLVNGRRIGEPTLVRDGDKIQVGGAELLLKSDEGAEARESGQEQAEAVSESDLYARGIAGLQVESFAGLKLRTRIWEGEYCCTFLAEGPGVPNPVAVKFVKPDARITAEHKERLLRGWNEATRLDHPRLVKVLRVGSHEGIPYCLMEHVEGKNLYRLLARERRPMKMRGALTICLQLLEALQYVHQRGLALRSVRPDNVLLVPSLGASITDYDLIKKLPDQEGTSVTKVLDADVFVEPDFAAPELIARPYTADQRADLFGVGACLFYMATVRAPFPDALPDNLPAHAFRREVPDVQAINPNVPDAVRDVMLRAMANYVDRRYQSAQEMKEALERAAAGL